MYLEYQPKPQVLPAYLSGKWGKRWAQATGILKDTIGSGATDALGVKFVSQCPEDALGYHGAARGWDQAPGETASEYRTRLKRTWELALKVGTKEGVIDALKSIGLTNVDVKENVDWGRSGDPQKVRWFWVIIRQPHPFGTDFSWRWGDGTKWGEKPWGTNGDPRLFELCRRIIRKMKPAHAFCREMIVVLSGDITEGTMTTDDGKPNVGAAVVYLPV